MSTQNFRCEKGGVLIITALLITFLVGLLALVIDVSVLFGTRLEKTQSADYIALAALNTYLSFTTDQSSATHSARLQAAIDRAASIGSVNRSTFENGSSQYTGESDRSGSTVKAGRWWLERPENCELQGCPCTLPSGHNDGQMPRGCFQSCDSNGCADPTGSNRRYLATSFEVTLSAQSPSSLSFFSKVSNSSGAAVKSSATAAVRPKRGYILFDLSRNMTTDSHAQKERLGTPNGAHEVAYEISGVSCPHDHSNPCISSNCTFASHDYWHMYENGEDPYGYQCYNSRINGVDKPVLFETLRTGWPAEPYSTFLTALNSVLTEFNNSAGPNDGIGVIGFDSTVSSDRIYPLLTKQGSGYQSQFNTLTSIASSLPNAAAAGFFPKPYSTTNLRKAIDEALTRLKKDKWYSSGNPFLLVMSNGLLNCTENDICENSYEQHTRALNEILQGSLPGELRSNEVAVHSIFASSQVRPRTALLKSPFSSPARCMTAREMYQRNYQITFSTDTSAQNAAKFQNLSVGMVEYFPGSIALASLSSFLGGTWTPIRPSCRSFDAGFACNGVDYLCDVASNPPERGDPVSTRNYAIRNPASALLDSEGRLLCDPSCRNSAEQAADAMTNIITTPLISLVQ